MKKNDFPENTQKHRRDLKKLRSSGKTERIILVPTSRPAMPACLINKKSKS